MGYKLGIYEKAMPSDVAWAERLYETKKAGFDFVELSVDETDAKLSRLDWTDAERRALYTASLDSGVPFRSMCLSGHRKYPFGSHDGETRRRSLEIMEKAIDLASYLGIRAIQLAGYDVYYETGDDVTRGYFAENLARATEMAAEARVLLGFETMETPFMDTVGKAMKYVTEINSPYLQVYPDIGNLTNASLLYNVSVADDLETGRGHIIAAHLKETVPGKYREIPFGTGHTDFVGDIKKLTELGVYSYVTEFWYTGGDWKENIREAHDFITDKFKKAEVEKNA
jgi:predicted hexulose-6-phosphate isomerase